MGQCGYVEGGGKVFALCDWYEGGPAFTFRVGETAFEVLGDAPGVRPAAYLVSRGMKWLQVYEEGALGKGELAEHIEENYRLLLVGMSRKKREGLSAGTD